MKSKFIFITGGVVSSLGKGIAAASIGALLQARGLNITLQKLDPYINVDPGTMNPYQHGEVFVTEDGAETDLDLGHYERFTDISITHSNNVTAGQVYDTVINNERTGAYLGGTVQVIPHITDEIKRRIRENAKGKDIAIVEIGGTVGDIESLPFLEAIRQLKKDVGPENVLYIHLTLVPYIKASGELKTKPTQHSVKELRAIGIQPDILLCRTDRAIDKDLKAKIALFSDVDQDAVIAAIDVDSIYDVPVAFHNEALDEKIIEKLHIWTGAPDLSKWESLSKRTASIKDEITIGIVGKYVHLRDSYKSLHEALNHGGIANNVKINHKYIDSEDIEKDGPAKYLSDVHGILVPGGFGNRGIEGKILAAKYAREKKIPYFGICLGMQIAVIEFARHVMHIKDANSSEFNPATKNPVIDLMPEQKDNKQIGGSMRLGAYECRIKPGTHAARAYGKEIVFERHRHRYEFNNDYRQSFVSKGMIISGENPEKKLVEIIELKNHPWFLGCQFHPEFKSRPINPHPLFVHFIKASLKRKK
ncbi:MAG: CTP synthase [bacterium]